MRAEHGFYLHGQPSINALKGGFNSFRQSRDQYLRNASFHIQYHSGAVKDIKYDAVSIDDSKASIRARAMIHIKIAGPEGSPKFTEFEDVHLFYFTRRSGQWILDSIRHKPFGDKV